MEERPRIRLNLSGFDKFINKVGLLLLITLWTASLYAYAVLPATIPIHFNISGRPDAYGGKISLFFLTGVATILYAGLTLLCRIPHHFNYLVKITADNAERQYVFATRMLRYIKVAVMLLFNLIILFTYLTATEKINGVGNWFLPLIILLFIMPVIAMVWYSSKVK